MSDLDDRIKKALNNDIKVTEEDKQEIWSKIEKDLFMNIKKGDLNMKNTNKKPVTRFVAAAAAAAIIFVGSQTDMGHALIDQIKELFVPEKEITQDIEGNKEKTNVNLNQSRESDYVIYIDEDRYTFIDGDKSDKIVTKTPLEEKYPEVSMEIEQVVDKVPEDVIKDIEENVRDTYETFFAPEEINEPIKGWTMRGLMGSQWDSEVVKYYVLSNGKGGSFVITQRYFLEAAEGHGARFEQMLEEFHIVNEK